MAKFTQPKTPRFRTSSSCCCCNTHTTTEYTIDCPKCEVEMEKLSNGKYIIDKCPECKGVFLDKEEIDNIGKQGFVRYVLNYFMKD